MNKKDFKTDFLTANSFKIGMGSVFNLPGSYFMYNYSETGEDADFIALAMDWKIVGQDIENAERAFLKENESHLQLEIPFAG